MTQTEVEAESLHFYLSARGYHVELHHADAAGITMTISRGPTNDHTGAVPLRDMTPHTPPYPSATLFTPTPIATRTKPPTQSKP